MNDLKINKLINEDNITFIIQGRIDSNNSNDLSEYVFANINENSNVVFDFEKIYYISSAGLRIVLKTQKFVKDFKVINLSSDVYEIFEMTGFSEIIKISKIMREISIEGKTLIGEGFMGKVYRLDPETIIKVYIRNGSLEEINREVSLCKKALILGLPTAIPFDIVKVKEGGYGSIFELLDSVPLNKLLTANPDKLDFYISKSINLLKQINSTDISNQDLPKKKDTAKEWLDYLAKYAIFDEKTLQKLNILIDSIPDTNMLIHGDFHIKNIMVRDDEYLLIDMDTLGVGHPIFEISAFYLSYIGYPAIEPGNTDKFFGVNELTCKKIFDDTFNSIYPNKSQKEKDDIMNKVILFSYMWLAYKTQYFEPNNLTRLNHAKEQVYKLIDKLDTLAL